MSHRERKIGFHQVLREDGSVHSHQWIALPVIYMQGLTMEGIVRRYLTFLRACTVTLIRPLWNDDGVTLRLLWFPLISFLPPVITSTGTTTTADLFINGGLLVQRDSCNRGQLRFIMTSDPHQVRIEVRLSDYCPLLLGTHTPSPFRKWLYHVTQATIHKIVTVRFLARLYSDLTGTHPPLNVMRTRLPDGEDI